jgi:hypothetical protein
MQSVLHRRISTIFIVTFALQEHQLCYNPIMQQQLSFKITGYLIAPHEWLRIWAYKLIGKRYHYRLGDHQAVGTEALSVREQLFCLLFPLGAGMVAAFGFALLWVFSFSVGQYPRQLPAYLWEAPLWHHALHLAWILLLTYTLLFSFYDVLAAFRLARQQRSGQ